jgi:hypothetical protein
MRIKYIHMNSIAYYDTCIPCPESNPIIQTVYSPTGTSYKNLAKKQRIQ